MATSGWELVGLLSDPWEHVSGWGAQMEGGSSPEDEAASPACPALWTPGLVVTQTTVCPPVEPEIGLFLIKSEGGPGYWNSRGWVCHQSRGVPPAAPGGMKGPERQLLLPDK